MAHENSHYIEVIERKTYGQGFWFAPSNSDKRIVNQLLSDACYPDYGSPRDIVGWRVIEAATGRVLDSDNWV
jgi:hypothetical protein